MTAPASTSSVRFPRIILFLAILNGLSGSPFGFATDLNREPCTLLGAVADFSRHQQRQEAALKAEQAAMRAQGLPVREVNENELETEAGYLARYLPGVRCERITYESDGLKITGFLWTPADLPEGMKIPVIVFNRGGTGDESKLRPNTQYGFDRFVREGYAVIGSQYRGNDGSEGTDELGGADVRDVIELARLTATLPFIDGKNMFALGYSRGAMMTLSAARDGVKFNAVALVGLPSDFRTPQFDRAFGKPSAETESQKASRSAILWAEKLDTPILLLQGGSDPLVSTEQQTLPFAARLQKLGKPYELVVYDRDTHGILISGADRDRRILAWFRKFRR